MSTTRLTAVPAPADTIDPVEVNREAWAHVANGYREALAVPGIDEDDAAMFRRSARRAENIAGLRHLGAV